MLSFGAAMRAAGAGTELLRELLQSGVSYNPLSARMAQYPYPAYAALRTRDPEHRSRLLKAWLFTRHSDVDATVQYPPREQAVHARALSSCAACALRCVQPEGARRQCTERNPVTR